MKLLKLTINHGRGSRPFYLNSLQILRIDFSDAENGDAAEGCDITLLNGSVLNVWNSAKSIFDIINS